MDESINGSVNQELVFATPERDVSGVSVADVSANVNVDVSGGRVMVVPPQKTIRFVEAQANEVANEVVNEVANEVDSNEVDSNEVANEDNSDSGLTTTVLFDVVVDVGEDVLKDMLKEVVAKVKAKMGELDMGSISLSTLPLLIRIVMEIVEHTVLKGNSQKIFATRVISELVDELPDSAEKGFLKATCASGGIEGTIDLVVAASKGELDVNKVAKVALKKCAPPFVERCGPNVVVFFTESEGEYEVRAKGARCVRKIRVSVRVSVRVTVRTRRWLVARLWVSSA